MFEEVKDSGKRQEFKTGAVRDDPGDKGRYDLVLSLEHMIYRLARHFQNGAVKYGDNNWRKGIPLARYIDSAFRHLCKHTAGHDDEDHLSAAIWNLMCHGETAKMIKDGVLPSELDDMPSSKEKAKDENFDKGYRTVSICDSTDDPIQLCVCHNCTARRIISEVQEDREPTDR